MSDENVVAVDAERVEEVAQDVGETAEKLDIALGGAAPVAAVGAKYRDEAGDVVAVQGENGPEAVEAKQAEEFKPIRNKAPAFIKRAGLSKPRRIVSRNGRIYEK